MARKQPLDFVIILELKKEFYIIKSYLVVICKITKILLAKSLWLPEVAQALGHVC